uniref:Fucolectin tachylectin-4 pentraxin-1 domain-containing protein n=1 Tax=Hucho hucho TaxID=62062 RepID=A0A4W5LJW2_9TELE
MGSIIKNVHLLQQMPFFVIVYGYNFFYSTPFLSEPLLLFPALPSTAAETAVTAPNLNLLRSLRRPAIWKGNMALMGRATQSSKLSRLTRAENAIDGRLDAEYLSGSCAHTRLPSDPWWKVDLLAVHRVTSITVTNREDCCPWRLDGAEILIGSSLKNNGNSNPQCAVISSIAAGDSVTFQCHGIEGRFVNIIRPGCFNPCLRI